MQVNDKARNAARMKPPPLAFPAGHLPSFIRGRNNKSFVLRDIRWTVRAGMVNQSRSFLHAVSKQLSETMPGSAPTVSLYSACQQLLRLLVAPVESLAVEIASLQAVLPED